MRWSARTRGRFPVRWPGGRGWLLGGLVVGLVLLSIGAYTTWSNLRLPAPGGELAVGRTSLVLVDESRPEPGSPSSSDRRNVPVVAWYPAVPGTGRPAAYIEDDAALRQALVASGELGALEVSALQWVDTHSLEGATVADTQPAYPVLLLSPGDATNVEFYSALAEDLASRGYVVIGMNHPYQVAAARLDDRTIAGYRADPPPGDSTAETATRAAIAERVADTRFVLDQLPALVSGASLAGGRLDLDRIGMLGHSNGGITAVSTCREDARLDACANLDGQLAGGPFGPNETDRGPEQPFLFLTKETVLHPVIDARFEDAGRGAFRVVVPAASHQDFTDGALLTPSVLPVPRTADHVVAASRGTVSAFFDVTLRDAPIGAFGQLRLDTDLFVNVYPLDGRPPLPVSDGH